jgi:hypothetical protein
MKQLRRGNWRDGYGRLVRIAGHQGRICRRAGPDPPNVTAGAPGVTGPILTPALGAEDTEAVAIFRKAHHPDLAQAFLGFLAESRGLVPVGGRSSVRSGPGTDAAALVADLLGATLVDAQDELWAAWASLERAGGAAPQAIERLTEPPPWPPTSVARYLRREGEHAMSLTETLAAEVAPEPAARAWLIRSWLAPERIVDQDVLAELAGAADGRLCREPRFRAWLRGEWTAWARQRYRRVARSAALGAALAPG